MKILFLASDCLPASVGGLEVYVHELARALDRRGHAVRVLSATSQRGARRHAVRHIEHEGIPITNVAHRMVGSVGERLQLLGGLSPLYRSRRMHDVVVRIIGDCDPDIVHVHHLAHLSSGIIASLKRRGIPVVVTLHDYWFLCANGQLLFEGMEPHLPASCDHRCLTQLITKARFGGAELRRASGAGPRALAAFPARFLCHYVRLRRRFFAAAIRARRETLLAELRTADRVLAPSRFLRDVYLSAGLAEATITYCDHGFDGRRFPRTPPRTTTEHPVRFAYMGRLVPEKGLHLLAEAFAFSAKEASLDVYGVRSERCLYYEEYVKSLVHRGSRVVFREPVRQEHLAAAYRNIDVLVVPSLWWENSPLNIREAFLAGVPVITSDIGGMRELVTEGTNGLLFRAGDAADLRRKMEMLVEDPSLISRLRPDSGKVKCMEAHAGEIEEVYRSVMTTDER